MSEQKCGLPITASVISREALMMMASQINAIKADDTSRKVHCPLTMSNLSIRISLVTTCFGSYAGDLASTSGAWTCEEARARLRRDGGLNLIDELGAKRFDYCLGLGVDLPLLLDLLDVKTHCVEGHAQLAGGGRLVMSLHQQFQETQLVGCEVIVGLITWANLTEQADHSARDLGRHGSASVNCFSDALQQARRWSLLYQVSTGSSA